MEKLAFRKKSLEFKFMYLIDTIRLNLHILLPNSYNYLSNTQTFNAQTFLKDCSSLLIQDASNAAIRCKNSFNNNKLIQQLPLGL